MTEVVFSLLLVCAGVLAYYFCSRPRPPVNRIVVKQQTILDLQTFFRSSADIRQHLTSLTIDEEVRKDLRKNSNDLYCSLIFLELIYKKFLQHLSANWDYVDRPWAYDHCADTVRSCLDVISDLNISHRSVLKAYREVLFFYKLFVLKKRPRNWLSILNHLSDVQADIGEVACCKVGERLYDILRTVFV